MILESFVGPSNQARARVYDHERSLNVYAEFSGAGRPPAPGVLLNRPGLEPYIALPAGNVRAIFAQDGRAFSVGGAVFAELFQSQTALIRGTVAVDSKPAFIASNGDGGHQLLVISGGLGYVFNLETNTLTQITDPEFPEVVIMGLFFDGYFIVLDDRGRFKLSDLEEGSTWNGLDVGQESQVSTITRAIYRNHDQLWLVSESTIAPWYNSGAASFPFQPVGGSIIQHGGYPYSFAALDNTLFCLGSDALGAGSVYRFDGYTPKHISTPAIASYLARVKEAGGRLSDAIGWACQFDAHVFYLLYLPTAPTTLVYDASTDQWAEWTRWNPNTLEHEPFRGRCHAFVWGRHLVGDRMSGTIYDLSLTRFTDRVRRAA